MAGRRLAAAASVAVSLASCAGAQPPRRDARAFRAPACHVTHVTEEERGDAATDLAERLRRAWGVAVQRDLQSYDDVMSGHLPAYEGFAWADGRGHGPMHGVVREEILENVRVRSLGLGVGGDGVARVFMRPSTRTQRRSSSSSSPT